jgi:hypothetical protein
MAMEESEYACEIVVVDEASGVESVLNDGYAPADVSDLGAI